MSNPSTDLALAASGLTKMYGSRAALDHLDLTVPRGGIHGFLGPNGAGKTTTIRIALGLTRPTSGRLELLGRDIATDLAGAVAHVGAIVEQPKFFPSFSGRHNLRLLAFAMGVSDHDVDEALELVGLSDRARDRFQGYSLGMKQRLAIAATLLKRPELLIFDEPTNGLDPAGVLQIRHTMRGLAEQGHTVLMSSHVLAEVEQLADTVSIINAGHLVAEGRLRDILGPSGRCVHLEIADVVGAATVLQSHYAVTPVGPNALEVRAAPGFPDPDPGTVNRLLAQQGHFASALFVKTDSLEQVFMKLTNQRPDSRGQVVA